MNANFWTGPAFLAGRRVPVANLGQTGMPQPSDYQAELDSYRQQAAQLPAQVAAPILETLATCEVFMAPENFAPQRIRGCLNSVLAQLRSAV